MIHIILDSKTFNFCFVFITRGHLSDSEKNFLRNNLDDIVYVQAHDYSELKISLDWFRENLTNTKTIINATGSLNPKDAIIHPVYRWDNDSAKQFVQQLIDNNWQL